MVIAKGYYRGKIMEIQYNNDNGKWLFDKQENKNLQSQIMSIINRGLPVFGTYCPDQVTDRYIIGVIRDHFLDPKKLIKIEADFDVEIEDDETGMEVY